MASLKSFRMLSDDRDSSPSPPPPTTHHNIPKLIVTQPSTEREDSPTNVEPQDNFFDQKLQAPRLDTQENNNNVSPFGSPGTEGLPEVDDEPIGRTEEGSVVKVTIPPTPKCLQSSESSSSMCTSTSTTTSVSSPVSPSSSSISIVIVQHDNKEARGSSSTSDDYDIENQRRIQKIKPLDIKSDSNMISSSSFDSVPKPMSNSDTLYNASGLEDVFNCSDADCVSSSGLDDSRLSMSSDHFEIIWSNLCYKIEPKWYKKISCLNRLSSVVFPVQTIDNHSSATSTASSSAGMNDNQHQMHSSSNADSHLQTGLSPRQKTAYDPIEIFSNLNGTIKSGQMTAVLGPSGAGKTTLLNCLTGKQRSGVSGHINLVGANGKHLKMCTIPQKDHLLELLTVEENLWFASKIKNPEYGFDHVKNIERVIDLLGLKRCRTAKIKKISGGQHKRVSIAQELLSNPDILVLDEPTSGLDSLTCFKTISMLRDLVELSANNDFMKPMAIIVTIHQPQPKVFNLFHHVYILANGGRVIYEGKPELSLSTITNMTGLQPVEGAKSSNLIPGAVDPASFLIEIASEEYGTEPIRILSEHQRNMFLAANSYRGTYNLDSGNTSLKIPNNLAYRQLHLNVVTEKDNRGFVVGDKSPRLKREISTTFTTNQLYDEPHNTKETRAEQQKQHMISSSNLNLSKRTSKKNKKNSEDGYNNSHNNRGLGSELSDASQMGRASSTSGSLYMSEQLLYTRESNHKGRFWSQTATLTHRTLLTIWRDPLLMTSRVLFHLMIPILMGYVYGKATGSANACPNYMPEIDIMTIPSLVEGKRVENMLEELHMSIENVSMFFITMYAFSAAVLALNALSFPLNMQVLLKETRNSWYSLPSFVVAKTLADLPLELTMPCLTMAMVYPLTGQPDSYMHWRMLTICLIMTLCSLIAQTQALILGALVMGSVQTAVFVSQASQLPWVILAGFTIRIKRLSEALKFISLTSFYRLGCEAITLARYGFGICPCNPKEITGEPVKLVGIPDQLRNLAQYWFDNNYDLREAVNDTLAGSEDFTESSLTTAVTTTTMATTTMSTIQRTRPDLFQQIANQLSFANSYGVNITSCRDVTPDRIRAIDLDDSWLVARIWHLCLMLVILKVVLYYSVKFSIGIRL